MRKRILALGLALTAVLALAPTASAEEESRSQRPRAPRRELGIEVLPVDEPFEETGAELLAQPDYDGAVAALRQGILAQEAKIDLRAYHIPATQEAIGRIYYDVFFRYGELFHCWSGKNWHNGQTLIAYEPEYIMTAAEYAAAKDFYDKELDVIVAQVPQDFSELEKVLFVHDYLAAHYEYDLDYENYDAYSLLRDGKGVCQAYMLAFSALMDRLGVGVSYVQSDSLNHTWNIVRVNGTWYHVDVTWDDPIVNGADVLGGAKHDYFLLSDARNEALRRADEANFQNDFVYGEDVTCPDAGYESGPWARAESPLVYVAEDGAWYYLSTDYSDKGLYRWDGEGTDVRVAQSESYYTGGISPLAAYEGCLFYADPQYVFRYQVETSKGETLFSKPSQVSSLSGLKIEDGELFYKDHTGTVTAWEGELLPWKSVPETMFSYYAHFGAVELRLPASLQGQVLLAWYDAQTGQMVKLSQTRRSGSFGAAGEDQSLTCKLFYLGDDGLRPLAPRALMEP